MRQVKDYLHIEKYPADYEQQLIIIRHSIYCALKDYPNFDGLDFTDVNGGHINIRAFHKDIKNYTYGNDIKLEYDFSNANEAIEEFIDMWKAYDTEEELESCKRFFESCEKYGFN
jgi:uncharacterized protein YjbK